MSEGDTAPRILVVAGAGGSGRTTVAAATAVRAAATEQTLLVSIGHVVDPALRDGDLPFDHVHLNPIELLATWWESIAARRTSVRAGSDPAAGFDPFVLEPPELTGLADAEHLLTLRAIRAHAQSGEYRTIVVDGPGFDGLVSLLTAPSSVAAYLERVWPRHVRLSGGPAAGAGSATGALAAVMLVEPLAGLAEQLAQFVADRSVLRLAYVLTSGPGRVARARDELPALEVLGVRPAALVLNRVIDVDDRFALDLPHPAVRRAADLAAAQIHSRAEVATIAADLGCAVVEVAEVDLGDPRTAAAHLDPTPLLDAPLPVPVPEVRRLGGDGLDIRYEWAVALPLVDPSTIGLGRVEEDVVVAAHGVRRRITLPSVLRRCVVAGASYVEGELRVLFAPDPEVWPVSDDGADEIFAAAMRLLQTARPWLTGALAEHSAHPAGHHGSCRLCGLRGAVVKNVEPFAADASKAVTVFADELLADLLTLLDDLLGSAKQTLTAVADDYAAASRSGSPRRRRTRPHRRIRPGMSGSRCSSTIRSTGRQRPWRRKESGT